MMYYHMTKSLLQTIENVPIVVALEGGYNLEVLPQCMESVALALLDEKWVENASSNQSIVETNSEVDDISNMLENINITTNLENGKNEMMKFLPKAYEEENIEPITKSAIQSINKSIRAIRSCWKEASLKEIKIAKKKVKRNTRLSVKNRLSGAGVDDLTSDLDKVNLE